MNKHDKALDDEAQVRNIIEHWARAISSEDRGAILAHHSKNLLMFDFVSIVRGIKDYDKTWDFFYAKPQGPISFVPSDLEVTAGSKVAFASCLIRCKGTSAGTVDLRLTVGLSKINDEWVVIHEHHSVPTKEERLLDSDDSGA